jgi:hypothetical protein
MIKVRYKYTLGGCMVWRGADVVIIPAGEETSDGDSAQAHIPADAGGRAAPHRRFTLRSRQKQRRANLAGAWQSRETSADVTGTTSRTRGGISDRGEFTTFPKIIQYVQNDDKIYYCNVLMKIMYTNSINVIFKCIH